MKKEEVTETNLKMGLVISEYPLNVRKEKSLKSKIIKVLEPKEIVKIKESYSDGQSDDFFEVVLNDDSIGYCLKEYIEIIRK